MNMSPVPREKDGGLRLESFGVFHHGVIIVPCIPSRTAPFPQVWFGMGTELDVYWQPAQPFPCPQERLRTPSVTPSPLAKMSKC
ncbi:hypothetical protein MKZ38_009653 [Zalerion maritima]|uniref:Uncharacterized protein n=1 Tax=Zalerion maritima TaxID=339359 RepID=A0AAD5WUZ3_9PEZI|nr:hypothetical protein MKZ38_009653 [Zalerion maritima]